MTGHKFRYMKKLRDSDPVRLLNPQAKAELVNELETEYRALREKSGLMKRETVSLEEAQKNKLNLF